MTHYVLFSGHMIDKPGRAQPRFPASKAPAAARAIRHRLQKLKDIVASAPIQDIADAASIQGIAAAACGGDILFHEACQHLNIRSEIYLGLPVEEFNKTSVAAAGEDWEIRYRRLIKTLPVHILHPDYTADAPNTIWEEANQWMLDISLSAGSENLTMIVLWDGDQGETGGAWQMMKVAGAHHATIEHIDPSRL